MNESTGQARMNAMDELRKMKGDVSRQEAQLADLKAKKNAWDRSHPSNAANDPTVKRLQDELLQVRQEIQSL
jgi:predicted  nucleic acid-binding Zn-ribbon protein